MTGKLIFLVLFFVLTVYEVKGQEDCVLKKSQDNILVYTCKSSDTKLKSIKATFNIPTRPSVLSAFMLDVPNFTKWQYNTIETTVLKRIAPNEIIYCSLIEAPWPVSNRDLVMHLKITQDTLTKVMTISLKSIPDYIPKKIGVVRIPSAEGKWVVEELGKNELRVNYSFLVDPGGSVPVWLINLALADGPYETFRNLKARVKSEAKIIPSVFIID